MTAPSFNPDEILAQAPWIRKVVRSMLADEHLADDLAQETLEAGLRQGSSIHGSTRSWLYGVAKNLHRQFLRGQKRREVRERRVATSEFQPDSQDLVERVEIMQIVETAVLALPTAPRDLLILRYYEELSVPQMAKLQGITVQAMESRLHRAKNLLRAQLQRRFGQNWIAAVLPLAGNLPATGGLSIFLMSKFTKVAAVLIVALLFTGVSWPESTDSTLTSNRLNSEVSVPALAANQANDPDLEASELSRELERSEVDSHDTPVIRPFPLTVLDQLTGKPILPKKFSILDPKGMSIDTSSSDWKFAGPNEGKSFTGKVYYLLPGMLHEPEGWMERVEFVFSEQGEYSVQIPYSSGIEAWISDSETGENLSFVQVRVSHSDPEELQRFRNQGTNLIPGQVHPRAFESPLFLQVQSQTFGGVEWQREVFKLDEDGRGVMLGLMCGPAMIEMFRSGYSPKVMQVNFLPGDQMVLSTTLDRRPKVEGYVKDESGEPVSGGTVVIVVRSSPDFDLLSEGDRNLGFAVAQEYQDSNSELLYAAIKQVRTDESGHFTLEVPRGYAFGAFYVGEDGYAESFLESPAPDQSIIILNLTVDPTFGRTLKLVDSLGIGIPEAICQMTIKNDPWYRQYPEVKSNLEGMVFLPWARENEEFGLLMSHDRITEGWDLGRILGGQIIVQPRSSEHEETDKD
jgi:RNA polymerase sigma-70 factor, ECF subfamily